MTVLVPPAGFAEQRRGKTLWWLKVGWEDCLLARIPSPNPQSTIHNPQSTITDSRSAIRNPQSAIAITSGRGTIHRIELETQGALIVRPYRRGGFVRHFTRDLYWDYPPRPFVELCCTEEVRRRGIPTVEVLGAQVERTIARLYRGLLVTREAKDFHNLWEWLQTEKSVDLRRQILTIVAQAIARMHNTGIVHADLNPTNILVSAVSESPRVLLLDFDRAQLFSSPVLTQMSESNLRRFQRFFRKYDRHEEWMTPTEFEHFRQVYEAARRLMR